MSDLSYTASVHSRLVKYTNFKGEEKETTLYFALDPISLLQAIASVNLKPNSKSGNPAKQNQVAEMSEGKQVELVKSLAKRAAGFPSEDGESWEPNEDFENSLAGKTFMTILVSSDAERNTFADKVILDPFRAFVNFAVADESNSKKDKDHFQTMLSQVENLFAPSSKSESLEERKQRLLAEVQALETASE